MCRLSTKNSTRIEYRPKLVKDIFIYPNIGALMLIKLTTSNCSKGELNTKFIEEYNIFGENKYRKAKLI